MRSPLYLSYLFVLFSDIEENKGNNTIVFDKSDVI